MKLSEAIRLGTTVVKEERSLYLMKRMDAECPSGCALGTALYAAGVLTDKRFSDDLHFSPFYGENSYWLSRGCEPAIKMWPWLGERYTEHGIEYAYPIAMEISSRHYMRLMTREEIAKWVETIEPKEGGEVNEVSSNHDSVPATDGLCKSKA